VLEATATTAALPQLAPSGGGRYSTRRSRAAKSSVLARSSPFTMPRKSNQTRHPAATGRPRKGAAPAVADETPTERSPDEPADAAEPAAVEAEELAEGATGNEPEPVELVTEDDDALGDVDTEADALPTRAIVPARPSALAGKSTAGLAPADLLQRYMADVSRYPLLSREDELDLSRRYRDTQDPALAYRLVTANLRLVVKIAWEYRRAAFNLLDLIQEGNVGLMQGVKKFDPERGVKLSSYAAWWIRAYIIRHLMDNWRMVKLGTTQAQRKIFFNLRKEKDKLAAQGFEPEPKLLAERMNVSEQDIVDMDRRLSNDEYSLDMPVGDDTSVTYGDRLTEGGQAVDDRLADQEIGAAFREKLTEFAKTLADKDRFIYEKRLIADEPMTLQEIGDNYGISRERARQIEARLTQRLKAYMREHLPGFDELSLQPRDE
jgi:RNA polymerase sigma-32 factor